MQIFFVSDIKGHTCVMDANESRHSIRVLRMRKGDKIKLVDGCGNLYEGFISNPDPTGCEITITDVTHNFEKREYWLHIAISPIKNQERFEWFVEKCVEIGVDELTPVICRNTERTGIRAERINSIIISAMKQSIKAFKPILNKPRAFTEFIGSDLKGIKMIMHCNPIYNRAQIYDVYEKKRDSVILIGPEGDFSGEELSLAFKNGFRSVQLGTSRMRTETAGIVACHSVYFINQ